MPRPGHPEPRARGVRPTIVLRILAATVLLLLAAGCGDEGSSAKPTRSASEPTTQVDVAGCPSSSPALDGAEPVGRADLDGDGRRDQLRLTAPDSDCPNLVVADTAAGLLAAQVPTDGPPVRTVSGIRLAGASAALLVTRQEHPRGGFQVRLFSFDGGAELRELRVDEQPLLPFVATDVQEHPLSVDCGPDGLVVTEAVPHEPAGVVFAWDIRRTSYAVTEGVADRTSSEEVADNVLPQRLSADYPALVRHQFLGSCRRG